MRSTEEGPIEKKKKGDQTTFRGFGVPFGRDGFFCGKRGTSRESRPARCAESRSRSASLTGERERARKDIETRQGGNQLGRGGRFSLTSWKEIRRPHVQSMERRKDELRLRGGG